MEFNNNASSASSQSQQQSVDSTASVQGLLRDMDVAPIGHWDELRGSVTQASDVPLHLSAALQTASPHWSDFLTHLGAEGIQSLPARHEAMVRQVRDNGITYNVHANADQPQRPWSLDLLPRVIHRKKRIQK